MTVTIDDLKKQFEVIEKESKEIYSLTIKKDDIALFTKTYSCCPHENYKNVKELVLAHCISFLKKNKIINN